MGDTHGGAAIGNTVGEFINGLGLVKTGQAQVVIRAVNRNVLGGELGERSHEFLEVVFATDFAHKLGGEVGVHAGAVPIERLLVGAKDRLAVKLDVNLVFLAEADQQIAGNPHVVGGLLGALAEDLELPLALGYFSVDAFVVDTGIQTQVEMLFDDLTGDVADILEADTGVIRTLRGGVAIDREAERTTVLIKEIFLLETEPRARVVKNGGAGVGDVRRAVCVVDFAHHQDTILASGVEIHGDGLQHAIGAAAGRLLSGATVKAPERELFELRKAGEFLHLSLAAETGNGLVTVEPDVFEFVFSHRCGF